MRVLLCMLVCVGGVGCGALTDLDKPTGGGTGGGGGSTGGSTGPIPTSGELVPGTYTIGVTLDSSNSTCSNCLVSQTLTWQVSGTAFIADGKTYPLTYIGDGSWSNEISNNVTAGGCPGTAKSLAVLDMESDGRLGVYFGVIYTFPACPGQTTHTTQCSCAYGGDGIKK